MSDAAASLNNYLATWEDVSFIAEMDMFVRGNSIPPSVVNAKRFRKLLTSHETIDSVDLDDFDHLLHTSDNQVFAIARRMQPAPGRIMNWLKHSQRIFKLSPEMQHAFMNIPAADIPMSDIQLPFESFAVELPDSITIFDDTLKVNANGESQEVAINVNAFLVTGPSVSNGFLEKSKNSADISSLKFVTALPTALEAYRAISAHKKLDMQTLKKRGNVRKTANRVFKFEKRILKFWEYIPNSFLFDPSQTHTFKDVCDTLERQEDRIVMQIISNLLLYLDARYSDIHEISAAPEWRRPDERTDVKPDIITKNANVFEIGNTNDLHQFSSDTISDPRYSTVIQPHWRRGYSRRKPGEGSDPHAKKSVKVKPTLVRADLIPEYGMPKSSYTTV